MEVAKIMNTITAKHEAQAAQATKSSEPVASANGSGITGTNSKH
jgi:hypothetical protein